MELPRLRWVESVLTRYDGRRHLLMDSGLGEYHRIVEAAEFALASAIR